MSTNHARKEKQSKKRPGLIGTTLKVVNIGISNFADDLRAQDVSVIHVDWKPPAGGDIEMLKILERLGS